MFHNLLVLFISITPSFDLTNPIQITNPLYYPYMITYVLFEDKFQYLKNMLEIVYQLIQETKYNIKKNGNVCFFN